MQEEKGHKDRKANNGSSFSGRLVGGRRFHLKVDETAHLKQEHKAVLLGAGCLRRKYTQEIFAFKAVCRKVPRLWSINQLQPGSIFT